MSPLVVLFSVLALAAAKPSGIIGAPVAYTAPLAYAAPAPFAYGYAAPAAAVSHQSRVDVKSSPAIVATELAYAAPIAPTVYAAPAPAVYAAPAPAVYAAPAPAVYAAPAAAIAAAPAAVSHQSRIDVKSSPAVIATELGYSAPYTFGHAIAAPAFAAPAFAAPAFIGAPSVPLDTPEVVAARAAHFEAKALAGAHHLRKRSVAALAYPAPLTYGHPLAYSAPLTYSTPLTYGAPLLHSAPLAYSSPLITKAYGVHPW